jgi:hypothetical protein
MAKYIRQIIIIIIKKKDGIQQNQQRKLQGNKLRIYFFKRWKNMVCHVIDVTVWNQKRSKMTMIWKDKISPGARMTDVKIKNSEMAVQR